MDDDRGNGGEKPDEPRKRDHRDSHRGRTDDYDRSRAPSSRGSYSHDNRGGSSSQRNVPSSYERSYMKDSSDRPANVHGRPPPPRSSYESRDSDRAHYRPREPASGSSDDRPPMPPGRPPREPSTSSGYDRPPGRPREATDRPPMPPGRPREPPSSGAYDRPPMPPGRPREPPHRPREPPGDGDNQPTFEKRRRIDEAGRSSSSSNSPVTTAGAAGPSRTDTTAAAAGFSRTGSAAAAGSSRTGAAGAGDGKSDRKDRNRLDMCVSREKDLTTKKGQIGQPVHLTANYFCLKRLPKWNLYQYRVDFNPPVEIIGLRKRLLFEQKPLLGGYIYDSNNMVFLTQKLANEVHEVMSKDRDGNEIQIILKCVKIVDMASMDYLQVLNIIMRRAMDGLNLQLVGRNLFDAVAKVDIRQHNLQLWPGYVTSIRQHESELMMCAEITHKVMRTETVFQIMAKIMREGGNFIENITNQVLGMTVLTDYNNKTYRIDDINFDLKPSSSFDTKNGPTTFIEYYKKKYNLVIRDHNQPMLVSLQKDKKIRGGESEAIALVPELCRVTGLSEAIRKDFRAMQSMADYFRMRPPQRIQRLLDLNQRLRKTPASIEHLRQCNLELDTRLVEFEGRILKAENIALGDKKKVPTGFKCDWQNCFRDSSMFLTVPLLNWVYIFPYRAQRESNEFLKALQQTARQMRFEIGRPVPVTINDDRNHTYLNAIEQAQTSHNPQMLVIVVPNNNADRYANIKKKCCVERPVATQVICQRTMNPKKGGLLSVATKVAIQINAKLGGLPWTVEIPLKGLMVIGIDVSHDTRDRGKSYGAMVATMNLQQNTGKFFSAVAAHTNGEELSNAISLNLTKALQAFKGLHSALPVQILIYRDGVGEGQTQYVYEIEVEQIKAVLTKAYAQSGSTPKLCFVVVSKRINTRIFHNQNNPAPGTVVDDVITLPERYDFFLVSQSVNQGTVSPTSYNILYDRMGLSPDRLQQLSYKMTHLYYNWSGTLRVPAVCQYAHKLAFLVGQCIHQAPANQLETQLYFL